jgi:hypothetical protein
MNKHLFAMSFLAGLFGLAWVGFGFINSSPLALVMTAVIIGFYVLGASELRQYRQATASLSAALAAIPDALPTLGPWLERLHPSLQNPVRLRVEGERSALPGPSLTPYLVGLLVMLGMLGTFLGMVITLKGTVFALEKTTDLQAMRAALAVPVKGLGLAFGTSVAGVIGSAMLGLMSALSRRERLLAAQVLDTRIATVLRPFTLAHQRQESLRALQAQSQDLPRLIDSMQSMMAQMESMGQQLNQRLLGNQEQFHQQTKTTYTELAQSVERSLRESLQSSAQAAGESIKPVMETALQGIAREAGLAHQRMAATVQEQVEGLSARFAVSANAAADTWHAAQNSQQQVNADLQAQLGATLAAYQDSFTQGAQHLAQTLAAYQESFEQRSQHMAQTLAESHARLQSGQAEREQTRQEAWTQSLRDTAQALGEQWRVRGEQTQAQQQALAESMLASVQAIAGQARDSQNATQQQTEAMLAQAQDLLRERLASEAQWLDQQRVGSEQLATLLRGELGALRDAEAARGQAAVERLSELQAALASHLTTLGTALEAPLSRLIEAAAEAPRSAAEVIAQLRQEISRSVARDNEVLDERSRILSTLNGLLDAINHASQQQREVIESLVTQAAGTLDSSSQAFAEQLQAQSDQLSGTAAQVTASTVEVASLAEALGLAVQSFGQANEKLIDNLQAIEAAMEKSQSRSDDQLAYYLAQAREIIDLSMSSQKAFVDELRRVPALPAAEEAR